MEPSFYPTLHGDVLSRANLYRWIREFFRASGMAPGYYLEFGVLNGEATIDAYRQLRGCITHYFGFDSFAGLPALSPEDRSAAALMPSFSSGNFASMSREQVQAAILAQSGMQPDMLTLQAGYFSQSLPGFDRGLLAGKGECRICYVDCDLHSSSQQVFAFLDPLVSAGTWILLDDYWCYRGDPREGQRRAFDEWIAASKRVGVSEYGNFKGWGKAYLAFLK